MWKVQISLVAGTRKNSYETCRGAHRPPNDLYYFFFLYLIIILFAKANKKFNGAKHNQRYGMRYRYVGSLSIFCIVYINPFLLNG